MRKILYIFAVIAALTAGAAASPASTRAENGDRLICDNFMGGSSDTLLINVYLDNTQKYCAMEGKILMPEGMTIYNFTRGPRAQNMQMVVYVNQEDRYVSFSTYSNVNAPFREGDTPIYVIHAIADRKCGNIVMKDLVASDDRSRYFPLGFDGGMNEALALSVDRLETSGFTVTSGRGEITVANAAGQTVSVYNMHGQLMASRRAVSDVETFAAAPGLYIVLVDGQAVKVRV